MLMQRTKKSRGGRKCCIPLCKSYSSDGTHLYQIPTEKGKKSEELAWVQTFQKVIYYYRDCSEFRLRVLLGKAFICEKHFAPRDILKGRRSRIKLGAFPTIGLKHEYYTTRKWPQQKSPNKRARSPVNDTIEEEAESGVESKRRRSKRLPEARVKYSDDDWKISENEHEEHDASSNIKRKKSNEKKCAPPSAEEGDFRAMVHEMYKMQQRGKFCDFRLTVSPNNWNGLSRPSTVSVHKLVFAAASNKIRRLRKTSFKLGGKVTVADVQRVVEFVYTQQIKDIPDLSQFEIIQISNIAVALGILKCISYLRKCRPNDVDLILNIKAMNRLIEKKSLIESRESDMREESDNDRKENDSVLDIGKSIAPPDIDQYLPLDPNDDFGCAMARQSDDTDENESEISFSSGTTDTSDDERESSTLEPVAQGVDKPDVELYNGHNELLQDNDKSMTTDVKPPNDLELNQLLSDL